MLITGYHSEDWSVLNRGVAKDHDGQPMCHVKRVKADGRVIVFRLVRYPNGWRNVGQFIPSHFDSFRPTPEKRGVKLSQSRIDRTLASFAETGHGNLFA